MPIRRFGGELGDWGTTRVVFYDRFEFEALKPALQQAGIAGDRRGFALLQVLSTNATLFSRACTSEWRPFGGVRAPDGSCGGSFLSQADDIELMYVLPDFVMPVQPLYLLSLESDDGELFVYPDEEPARGGAYDAGGSNAGDWDLSEFGDDESKAGPPPPPSPPRDSDTDPEVDPVDETEPAPSRWPLVLGLGGLALGGYLLARLAR